MGRPHKYKTSEELEAACDDYFERCDRGEEIQVVRRGGAVAVWRAIPYTVPDLAYALGYSHRSSIFNLTHDPVFSSTIKRALSRIEGQRVRKALQGEQESRFAQFDLINNCGYTSSKQEVNVNQQITFTDDELDARLANLERKTQQLEDRQDQDVIDITPQPSLLE